MKSDKRVRLAALLDEAAVRRARLSLRVFVELVWRTLEPGVTFQPNWHIDLICEYLEAVTAGEIHRLVINIPPRYMKSLLVSVLWPCWEWYLRPEMRFVFSSYAESLASRHSLNRRRLIRSRLYQRFAPDVRLTRDQQEKSEFDNTLGGIMVATSTGGSITGKGGNRVIIDDPHNPTQAESDSQRQQAIEFYRHTLSTRLDDPKRDAVVLVMQRLHTRDLTAVCLEQGFTHVCLPALAPSPTRIVFPRSGRVVVRALDEPLWPERQGAIDLEAQRQTLGSYGFAGQYQQQPVPRDGGMFNPGVVAVLGAAPTIRHDRAVVGSELQGRGWSRLRGGSCRGPDRCARLHPRPVQGEGLVRRHSSRDQADGREVSGYARRLNRGRGERACRCQHTSKRDSRHSGGHAGGRQILAGGRRAAAG
jgi:hypothetical protein